MSNSQFRSKLDQLWRDIDQLLTDPDRRKAWSMPGKTYFLPSAEILALPRDTGDSRYPYGNDGFNFWTYASGYMHGNEGLFSTFLRAAEGQEPKIAFFAGNPLPDGSYVPISLLPVPRLDIVESNDVARFSVLGQNAAFYLTRTPELRFGIRVSVTVEKQIFFAIHVRNDSTSAQRLYLSSFLNPYLRHDIHEDGENRWFKEVQFMEPTQERQALGSFLVTVHEDKDRHSSMTHSGVLRRSLILDKNARMLRHEETTSRYQYVGGVRSSLHSPVALYQGSFIHPKQVTTFTDTAIIGDLVEVELKAQSELELHMNFSCHAEPAEAERVAQSSIAPPACDVVRQNEEKPCNGDDIGTLQVRVDGVRENLVRPNVFNLFFVHLKKQVEFCSLLKGYVQLSANSLIGIRDVFQALEGLLFWDPDAARKKMLEAMNYTSPDGRCFRQYSLPNPSGQAGRMDLRLFIDQGCWILSTTCTYLRVTGDWTYLETPCSYHRITDEALGTVERTDEQESVLQHLLKIMDYLLENRDHAHTKCVLALYGDWNDALDGLGIPRDPSKSYGSGVSVMATLQVVQNTQELIEILEHVDPDKYASTIQRYREAAAEIEDGLRRFAIVTNGDGEQRILHGWGDERSYLVGSYEDSDGQSRDGLTSNAFWVLSGLYGKDLSIRSSILSAFDRLDSTYGYQTFAPAFPRDAPGVGRIVKLPPGTAENGAAYIHATSFAIMALFQMGEPRRAWEQLLKILPFTDIHDNLSHSPFVMPNSYGLNEDKLIDGENMNDWQTGSSNVVLKLLIRFVFGVEPVAKGLWVQPAAWLPFEHFEFSLPIRGSTVSVSYQNRGGTSRSLALNGETREGVHDPIMDLNRLWISYPELESGDLHVEVVDGPTLLSGEAAAGCM